MTVPSGPHGRSNGPHPPVDVHGAIDLSPLTRPAGTGTAQPAASAVVIDVTEADFAKVVERSADVPVLISLWTATDPASSTVTALLAELTAELGGRLLLARVDVERAPGVAQAVGSQTGSTVAAVVKGQAVPLPPLDTATREQVGAVLDQVLAMAASNGVTGRITDTAPDEPDDVEPPLPPLHAQAYEAIERDDLDAAVEAYTKALNQNPKDDMARAGLAQVELLRRVRSIDAAAARAAAAASPDDLDAQLAVADLDVSAGAVEDAFTRLLDAVRATSGPDRERVRVHLVDLFVVVGDHDPRVTAARRALANALY